ncbi:hypothetical protein HPP92_025816 [Vanilla planifolia]|uniref:Uncharacterized protein n=1 Tax=Vanilla planifolia TaxID=51239 RepID=A0A835PHC0_VANPL|nr:hypothetical protein HPP92_025816 [Vanilla planifolia]
MAASSVESSLLIIAVIAVANIIGSTAATAAPAPAPASSANSLSSPLVAIATFLTEVKPRAQVGKGRIIATSTKDRNLTWGWINSSLKWDGSTKSRQDKEVVKHIIGEKFITTTN